MKILKWLAVALLAILFFAPQDGEIRNAPLLIAILCFPAAWLIYSYIQTLVLYFKLSKSLERAGFLILSRRVYLNKGALTARGRKEIASVSFVRVRKRVCKYHFESPHEIELFKTTRAFSKGPVKMAIGSTYTRLVGRIKLTVLPEAKANAHYVILDKLPLAINDTYKKEELGNGDAICHSEVILYELSSFIRHIKHS